MQESKIHENLRYLGYTIGIFGGTFVIAMLLLFLGEIIAFLLGIIHLVAFLALAMGLILAGIYMGFFRKKE